MLARGFRKIWCRELICGVVLILAPGVTPAAEPANTNKVTVVEIENQVEIRRAGAQEWDKACDGPGFKGGRPRPDQRKEPGDFASP